MPIVLLHGWNGTSDSLQALAKWLSRQGFTTVDIFLGDYLSMNDEITLYDLGFAFQRALRDKKIPQTRHSFDLIVHSTGGLVAREYLRQICQGDATKTPIKHLCMLAPANFGSPLAKKGKSLLGRVLLGWDWDHLFQTGEKILDALELASPYTWQLADDDLFTPRFKIFSPEHTLTTVLVGTRAFESGIGRTQHENGSDNTVRVSTANLNAHKIQLDFSEPTSPKMSNIPRNVGKIAFGVFDRSHSSILDPNAKLQREDWTKALLGSLRVSAESYETHVQLCEKITGETFSGKKKDNPEWYHEYMHVVFRLRDQHGHPIDDYFIEFYQEKNDPKDAVFAKIHSEILEKVAANSTDKSCRSFLFDITDLTTYLSKSHAKVKMSLCAAHLSERIRFRNPPNEPTAGIDVFSNTDRSLVFPNEPVLVEITLYRDPSEKVFRLKKL